MKSAFVLMFFSFCLGALSVGYLTHSLVSSYRNLNDRFRADKELALAKVIAIRTRIEQRASAVGAEAKTELQKLKELL